MQTRYLLAGCNWAGKTNAAFTLLPCSRSRSTSRAWSPSPATAASGRVAGGHTPGPAVPLNPTQAKNTEGPGAAPGPSVSDEYNELQPKAAKATGSRATEVGGKNQYRDGAEAIFVALLLLIEANYPQT